MLFPGTHCGCRDNNKLISHCVFNHGWLRFLKKKKSLGALGDVFISTLGCIKYLKYLGSMDIRLGWQPWDVEASSVSS